MGRPAKRVRRGGKGWAHARLERVAQGAAQRACALVDGEGSLCENRLAVARAASEAEREVNALFAELGKHRQALQHQTQGQRKVVWQLASDRLVAIHALRLSVHVGPTLRDSVLREHVDWLLGQCARLAHVRRCEFVFRARDPGTSRLRVLRDDPQWEARPVAPTALPPMHTARSDHAAALTPSGHVCVMGGWGPGDVRLDVCEQLNPSREAWEQLPAPIPTLRRLCRACTVGDFVVVVGGQDSNFTPEDVVEAFDTRRQAWCSLPCLPVAAHGIGVAALGHSVFVVGGCDSADNLDAAFRLDLEEWVKQQRDAPNKRLGGPEWVALPGMQCCRFSPGVAAGGGQVFVCGGNDSAYQCTELCERFDNEHDGTWASMPPMPAPTLLCGCCYGGGNVFVVGGECRSATVGSVFAFSVRAQAWTVLADLVAPRKGCAAVCDGRRLLVLGGTNGRSMLDSGEMFAF